MSKAFHAIVKVGGNYTGMECIDRDTCAHELVSQKAATFIRRKIAAVGEKIAELERVQTYLTSKLAEMLQEENASA